MNEVKFKANVEDLKSLSLIVDEIEETVNAIPVPTVADDGKLLGVTLDETGETPVAQYELVDAPDPLPAIASGDAGKVLTVNAGETGAEWAAPSGGGGDNVFIATYTFDPGTGTIACDKTYSEIESAWSSGKIVIGKTLGRFQVLALNDIDLGFVYNITDYNVLYDEHSNPYLNMVLAKVRHNSLNQITADNYNFYLANYTPQT